MFSWFDYQDCLTKIQSGETFEREYKSKDKKVKFSIALRECDNGLWENNLYVLWNVAVHEGGYSHPSQIYEFQSYEEICNLVNEWLMRI